MNAQFRSFSHFIKKVPLYDFLNKYDISKPYYERFSDLEISFVNIQRGILLNLKHTMFPLKIQIFKNPSVQQ